METAEEFVASNDQTQIIKRKRTKRQRLSSPFGLAMTSSSSSGCGGGGGGGGGGGEREVVEDYGSTSSPTTSDKLYESTEEEEDMANCLIMLAYGEGSRKVLHNEKLEKFSSRKSHDMANITTNKAGFFVYECKTCNRSFPSFQALGGHRASHKRPKAANEEKKPQVVPLKEDFEDVQFNTNSPLSLQVTNNKVSHSNKATKIHECSICGAEFTSGQALGGHMRRHRAAAAATTSNQVAISIDTSTNIESHNDEIKPRNILALDLNLPAPEDDHRGDTKFQFASTQPPPLVFSAPALVDCHY